MGGADPSRSPRLVNIREHFKEQEDCHLKAVDSAQLRKEELSAEISRKRAVLDSLESDRQRKKAAAEELGLDPGEKLQGIDQQVKVVQAEISALCAEEQAIAVPADRDFARVQLLVTALEEAGLKEALEVEGIADIVGMLPVGQSAIRPSERQPRSDPLAKALAIQLDDLGRLTMCSVGVSKRVFKPIKIKVTDKHYFVNARPASLEWIPSPTQPIASVHEPTELDSNPEAAMGLTTFLDRVSGRLVLTERHRVLLEREPDNPWQRKDPVATTLPDDFSDLVDSLEAHIDNAIQQAGGELDLDQEYPDNPLFAHVRARLLPLTNSRPTFQPCTEELPSQEIALRIKYELAAFVAAPWSEHVVGSLALLKFHLEERPDQIRLWSTKFQNVYGFRLRTRDHDWLEGQMHIAPWDLAATKTKIVVDSERRQHGKRWGIVATCGRLSLLVDHDLM